MKLSASILAAGAILALAAPTGYAVRGTIPADGGRGPGNATTHGPAHKVVSDPPPNIGKLVKARLKVLEAQIKGLSSTNTALCAASMDLDARNRDLDARLQTALATIQSLTQPSPEASDNGQEIYSDWGYDDVLRVPEWERYCPTILLPPTP